MTKLASVSLSAEGVAFDPAAGNTFFMNPSGKLIFAALQRGGTETDTVKLLVDTYELPRDEAERDFTDFYGRLRGLGLV